MEINTKNLIAHELIGLKARIEESNDPTLKGLTGIIVDETKNMLRMSIDSMIKSIPKSIVTLRFWLPDGSSCIVRGKMIVGRPEDRVKKLRWKM
ncbi:MAG: ribonuclease P protein component 1 [Nitrososphaerota archaeon]|nr:ribonuclease P protein component 1 [Nitrososphaerales archaeon]MCX8191312.1 ribonuclease P protein component 1 [Nitrososphaerales archaeon]MDW8044295.1 ribonuclease P protein component 1 [Nitrososphaerota archaeon]